MTDHDIAEAAQRALREAHDELDELRRQLDDAVRRIRQLEAEPEGGKLAAIRGVLDRFDWERDDRQYALEKIEQIATTSRVASGPELGGGAYVTPEDLATVLSALADADEYRMAAAAVYCRDCEQHPAGACEEHVADVDAAQSYRELGEQLGGAQ